MNVRGQMRTADAKEAAAWVGYCNDPKSREREAHGHAAPLRRAALADRQRNVIRQERLRSRDGRVSYARILNTHQRHGDLLKIATAADFCGTRWQNNVIIPTPKGNNRAYLQPVARVMQLYRHHIGSHAIKVADVPPRSTWWRAAATTRYTFTS